MSIREQLAGIALGGALLAVAACSPAIRTVYVPATQTAAASSPTVSALSFECSLVPLHGQSYAANAVNVVLTAINNTGQPVTLETESVVFYDGNEEISSVPDIGWDEVISAGQSVRGTVETNISGSNITSCQVVAYNAY